MALVIGALIDGIPEAASIGISLLENRIVSLSVIISVITNIPEGSPAVPDFSVLAGASKQSC